MADVSVTAANVRLTDMNTKRDFVKASETIGVGDWVCLLADGRWGKTDCDGTNLDGSVGLDPTKPTKVTVAMAASAADADKPFAIGSFGNVNPGGSVTAKTPYYLSKTAGKICPLADLTTGCKITQVGFASASDNIVVNPQVTGLTV